MSKLYKLREWLTIAETANHLTGLLGERILEQDVLRLGLDHDLHLSCLFIDLVYGQKGKPVQLSDSKIRYVGKGKTYFHNLLPPMDESDTSKDLPDYMEDSDFKKMVSDVEIPETRKLFARPFRESIRIDFDDEQSRKQEVIQFSSEFVCLQGIYDLALMGGDRVDLEMQYQSLTSGPIESDPDRRPVLVTGMDLDDEVLCIYRLHRHVFIPLEEKHESSQHWNHESNFLPIDTLPKGSQIVVKVTALTDFVSRITRSDEPNQKERNNLHNIIGCLVDLLRENYKDRVDYSEQKTIIAALQRKFNGTSGLKQRNLETVFARANKNLGF